MSPIRTLTSLSTIALLVPLAVSGCASKGPYQAAVSEDWSPYGPVLEGDPPATTIDEIASNEPTGPVVLMGTVRGVCQTKGCWMQVAPEGATDPIFVKFRDYGFFVPRNAAGRYVVMRGTPVYTDVSVEMLRHYARDAGRSEAEIMAIADPQRRIEFVADSVLIQGRGLQDPYVAETQENCDPETVAEETDASEPDTSNAMPDETAPGVAPDGETQTEASTEQPSADPIEEPVGAGLLEDPSRR